MTTSNLTVVGTGGALMGAGLQMTGTNFYHGLILIGIGAAMQVLVAFLQKQGVPVSAPNPLA